MPTDASQQQKFQKWFNQKAANKNCPVCSQAHWVVGDIIAGNAFVQGGMSIGGQSVPMAQLICDNCGYVMLFAAVKLGLVS